VLKGEGRSILGFRKSSKAALCVTIFAIFLLSSSYFIVHVHASEPPLTEIFNYLGFTNVAETSIETFSAGTYNTTLYAEFAGYFDENELSYYEIGTSVFSVVFAGPEGGSGYLSSPVTKPFTADFQFGLSMLSPGPHRYFSETSRNSDGEQHAKVYENLDDPNMFLIGFENQYGAGDRDYNDMVFSLECVHDLTVSAGAGGTTDPVPGVYSHPCCSYASVTAVPDSCYVFDHWMLDTVDVGSANPYSVLMDDDHALHAVFTYSPPSLSVSISPLLASFVLGDSVSFTSTVSGGESPYSYQWYLDDAAVSGATSSSWTFTPTSTGIYYVYMKVTDACDSTAQSETARITALALPVGGYSVSLTRPVVKTPLIFYTILLVMFGVVMSLIRRKRK